MSIKQALISVHDKTLVVELGKKLTELGIKIISSGGTAQTLANNKVPCTEISAITGFPEILDGRVKTLNPKIHGGILARRDSLKHLEELDRHNIDTIDIVVVNLYPFEETIAKLPAEVAAQKEITRDIIENIDIGGVALLRAAAKNHPGVLVICETSDYFDCLEKIEKNQVTPEYRRMLAAKAFRYTAYYDSLIAGYLTTEEFPQTISVPLRKQQPLRYGENPHQKASLYKIGGLPSAKSPVVSAKQLHGKELSYNNYLDLDAAWRLVLEFDSPACAIIKHNNPCGCAQGWNALEAYVKALACDPVSAYGGIVAFNQEVNETTALEIVKTFTECVIAPGYTTDALKFLRERKNLRVLELPPYKTSEAKNEIEFKTVSGGMLVQDRDNELRAEEKAVTERGVSEKEIESLRFAWTVCKHVKSNAVILVRGKQTVAIGAGQMSRIDSLKIAVEKMKEMKLDISPDENPLVLASDAFFPFPDVVNESAKIGVSAIIQPGGSIRDDESIKAADQHKMAMLFTGMRHFKH